MPLPSLCANNVAVALPDNYGTLPLSNYTQTFSFNTDSTGFVGLPPFSVGPFTVWWVTVFPQTQVWPAIPIDISATATVNYTSTDKLMFTTTGLNNIYISAMSFTDMAMSINVDGISVSTGNLVDTSLYTVSIVETYVGSIGPLQEITVSFPSDSAGISILGFNVNLSVDIAFAFCPCAQMALVFTFTLNVSILDGEFSASQTGSIIVNLDDLAEE